MEETTWMAQKQGLYLPVMHREKVMKDPESHFPW